jgi:hypothetical protein
MTHSAGTKPYCCARNRDLAEIEGGAAAADAAAHHHETGFRPAHRLNRWLFSECVKGTNEFVRFRPREKIGNALAINLGLGRKALPFR